MTALLALLLALRAASAAPEDALDPLLRGFYLSAIEAEAHNDCRRATPGYELVRTQEPSFVPALLGLARCREREGDVAGAMEIWRELPNEAEAVEAMARRVETTDPGRAAELYHRLQTLRLGDPEPHLWEARALANVDPLAALESLRMYLGVVDGEPDGAVLIAVAVGLRDAGQEPRAIELLLRYLTEFPTATHADEARGRMERWAVESAARTLAIGIAEPLRPEARQRVEAARRLVAANQLEAALAALREIVRDNPRSAEAWGGLAEVFAALGEVNQAERAWAHAAELAPDEPDWHARLGSLIAQNYGGRRDAEAAVELGRALALRPGWAEVHFQRGEVLQRLDRWDEAVSAYDTYLRESPHGVFADEARRRIDDLRRALPEPTVSEAVTGCGEGVTAEVCTHYRIARVYQVQRELDLARSELDLVLAAAPSWPPALNLAAALALESKDAAGARRAWEASLASDPQQPTVLLALGEQRRRDGSATEAERLFRGAAKLGASEASYWLAEMAWARGETDEASALLEDYFTGAGTGSFTWDPAIALRDRLRAHAARQRSLLALSVGVGLAAALGLWLGRRRGATVAELAARAPESVQELTRSLAALRHEVLKHNTTLLPEVAAALERGDHAAVRFAADRLFGESGGGGILERFDGYLGAIERLGARSGLPLDLRRKDPVLAPMCRAMRRLRVLEPRLRRPGRASPRLVREIGALSQQLNVESYRGLGRLIREISTLTVDPKRLRAVDAAVRAEPAFAGQALPELVLDAPEDGLPVRVTAGDLDDIVANLLRNAYRVVGEELPPVARRVGLAMDEEDDPVTGLETVQLRFRDNAPRELTSEMIRDREVGRGLGLVLQMVGRNNGTITVERERGWAKAVVVRLPRADAPDEADTVDLALNHQEPGLGGQGPSLGARLGERSFSGPERP